MPIPAPMRRSSLLAAAALFQPAVSGRPHLGAAPRPDALSFTLPGASQVTGISRSGLYRFVEQGKLRKITIAGRCLIEGDSLRALIAGAPTGNARKGGPGRPRKIAA